MTEVSENYWGSSKRRYVLNSRGYTAHHAIVDRVRPSSRILDVGCASGYLMATLRDRKTCECVGIEPDEDAASEARKNGLEVLVATAENGLTEVRETFGLFDYVILADVLEHTVNPETVLAQVQELLIPSGVLLVSLPNIASLMARVKIVRGRWEYEDTGIFDRTHLRFFQFRQEDACLRRQGFGLTTKCLSVL